VILSEIAERIEKRVAAVGMRLPVLE
jgi:hypothetical protein